MKTTIVLTLSLLAAIQPAVAQNPAAAPAAPAAVAPAQAPAATVASTAPTNAPETEKVVRDPFLPVDYVRKSSSLDSSNANTVNTRTGITRPQNSSNAVPSEVVIHWPDLKVKGLIKQPDGTYLAIIDGIGMVEEGQLLSLKSQGHIFRIKIKGITDKGILQQRLDYKPAGR